MSYNNATNLSVTGVVTASGTGTFTGSSVTQYQVVLGGASNALTTVSGTGTANQVLTSNGASAAPSWQTLSAGGFSNIIIQVFGSSGTYTPSANLVQAVVILTGAGGGGGNLTSLSNHRGGGGGGAGETRIGSFSAATIGASQTITIGSGGSSGNNGGNSSFGSLMTSVGGFAGDSVNGSSPRFAKGGNTGFGGSGGQLSITNGIGQSEYATSQPHSAVGGTGANSYWSYGGIGGYSDQTIANENGNGGDRGAGGGGGAGSGANDATGGPGGNGYCVIYEYIA